MGTISVILKAPSPLDPIRYPPIEELGFFAACKNIFAYADNLISPVISVKSVTNYVSNWTVVDCD